MSLDAEFVKILACPVCKSAVISQVEWLVCTNQACALKYPIRDGIPIMLVNEAEKPHASP